MRLLDESTNWVLVAGSREQRHFLDLLFGAQILLSLKIDPSKILIFTDYINANRELKDIGVDNISCFNCRELCSFSDKKPADCENVVFAISGHGNEIGILYVDDKNIDTTLKSMVIINEIRRSKAKEAIIICAQCNAGVFNYIDARSTLDSPTNICVVGATNLHDSISIGAKALGIRITKKSGHIYNDKWLANIFFAEFFKWIKSPIDVDGDGKKTILDAYRYSGVKANQLNKMVKIGKFYTAYKEFPNKFDKLNKTNINQVEKEAINQDIEQILMFCAGHQEPWILHADHAREIEV